MSVCEDLQKKLSENGSYAETLREKILYCIGYLESDDENDDLYNLFTYMLYSEKVYPDEPLVPKYFVPKLNFDNMEKFQRENPLPDKLYNELIKERFDNATIKK